MILLYKNIIFNQITKRKISSSILVTLLLFPNTNLISQSKKLGNSFWNLKNINGYLLLEGSYYDQKSTLNNSFVFNQRTSQYNGTFSLNSSSYIIHPNFLELNMNVILRPGTIKDKFIIMPSRSSVTTAENIIFRSKIFKQLPLNGGFNFTFDHSFTSRESTSNSENNGKTISAYFNYRNSFVPISLVYVFANSLQDELELNRLFKNKRHNLNTIFSNHIGRNITNKLTFNYSSTQTKYSTNNIQLDNKIFDVYFSSSGVINLPKQVSYLSSFRYNNNRGDNFNSRIQVLQNISTELPYNLKLITNYKYFSLNNNFLTSKNNSINASLNHKLFESLFSYIALDYSNFKQTTFSEISTTFKGGFNYTKHIPTGQLSLSYNYSKADKSNKSSILTPSVINEEHSLIDGHIELLNNANVSINSIMVSNFQNTIIYQKDFDYEIIQRGKFIEIRRILGGQLLNNSSIYVNYQYEQNNSYNYVSHQHTYSVNVILLNNFLEVSYFGNDVSINNKGIVTNVSLRDITQREAKISFHYNNFSVGYKKNNFNSNITPYITEEYFLEYSYVEPNNTLLSFNVNYRKQNLIADNEIQKFADVVGKLTYYLSRKARILFEGSYRNQIGRGINLDLQNFKVEFQSNYRSIQIALGSELYNRIFLKDKINYFRGYVKLQRNF